MKRTFDLAASAVGLLILAPVIACLVLAVRRDSSGPGIFRQTRVGRHGVSFTCYKLRTMRTDAPNVATHHAPIDAVTSLGAFLRRWKFDEVPQLWNVLKGDMSLVGPRPCLPLQVELVEARRRLGVDGLRPGVTGLGQVRGLDMSDPERLARCDRDYLDQRSFAIDLKIILYTVLGRRMP